MQKVQGFFAIDYVHVSKQELRSIKSDVFRDEFVHACCSMLFTVVQ